jgi:hypothetical protein
LRLTQQRKSRFEKFAEYSNSKAWDTYEVIDIVLRIYDIFNDKNKRVEHLRGYAATAA